MTTYVERELIRRRVYKRHQIIDKVKNFILCVAVVCAGWAVIILSLWMDGVINGI